MYYSATAHLSLASFLGLGIGYMFNWTRYKAKRGIKTFNLRPAKPEDYNDVLNIDQSMYWGRDYLPTTYHDILQNPKFYSIVCESSEKNIVGFSLGHIVDGSDTLVLAAGRVKDSHQGQGLTRRMISEIRRYFLSHGVHFRQEMMTTKNSDLARKKRSFREDYKDIQQRDLLNFAFQDLQDSPVFYELNKLCADKTAHLLDLKKTENMQRVIRLSRRAHLLDNVPIVVNWTPLSLLEANVDEFVTRYGFGFASLARECPKPLQSGGLWENSSTANGDNPKTLLLSFGNYFPCHVGMAYNIDLHCSEDNVHPSFLKLHIAQHLLKASMVSAGRNIHMIIFVAKDAAYTQQVVKFMKELTNFRNDSKDPWGNSRLHLYQKMYS